MIELVCPGGRQNTEIRRDCAAHSFHERRSCHLDQSATAARPTLSLLRALMTTSLTFAQNPKTDMNSNGEDALHLRRGGVMRSLLLFTGWISCFVATHVCIVCIRASPNHNPGDGLLTTKATRLCHLFLYDCTYSVYVLPPFSSLPRQRSICQFLYVCMFFSPINICVWLSLMTLRHKVAYTQNAENREKLFLDAVKIVASSHGECFPRNLEDMLLVWNSTA